MSITKKSNLCKGERKKETGDIIHNFLMHIVLHSYIMARTHRGLASFQSVGCSVRWWDTVKRYKLDILASLSETF